MTAKRGEPAQGHAPESGGRALASTAHNRCFGCGAANRAGLRLNFFAEGERVASRVRLARRFEGPPGHAHGGVIATLLDEAMSKANRARGVLAMTRQMEVEYLRPVPLGKPLRLTGWTEQTEGRKQRCQAELQGEDGTVLARAKGLFLEVTAEMLSRARG